VNIISLPIERDIRFSSDLKALFLLISIFYKKKFDIVHSVSPKAGLINAIAAWICRIPNRLHTFTGQVWVTKKGIIRWLLKSMDKIIVLLNTFLIVDSFSQQNFLISQGVLTKNNSIVIGKGSISGVDISRFIPSNTYKTNIRKKLSISHDSFVFLFVGRLKKEKGIIELVEAFKNICKNHENISLLILGQDEEKLKTWILSDLSSLSDSVRVISFTNSPEKYMAASDVFVLPSYREGFGSAIIEAASCEIPSIGSNIYGLSDAIHDGQTGLLVPARSIKLLENAMVKLINNDELRSNMGRAARQRAVSQFSQETITKEILQLYKGLIQE
jgi:glycosyltransferase involved in cell wall biosynthesis